MKNRLNVCFAVLLMLFPFAANAQSPQASQLYFGAFAGIQNFSDIDAGFGVDLDFGSGYVIGGVGGWRVNENFRIEAEAAYQWADADLGLQSGDIWIFRTTLGGYFEYPVAPAFAPFVGAGVGISAIEIDNVLLSGSAAGTFHGEIGLAYRLRPKLTLVPAARYEWNNVEFVGGDDGLTATSLRMGVHFSF
ncbi:MAG: porin family protein [Pseudomonadota bacterium]